MKNFIKLTNFELNRFSNLFFVLILLIFVLQTVATIVSATTYMRLAKNAVMKGGITETEFVETYSPFSILDVTYSVLFFIPIAMGVVAILFYIFFIWYRDWFTKNTFIYRLLMLPTSRMNIYFAKVTTIMLTVLTLVAFQLVNFLIQNKLIKWLVPAAFREDYNVTEAIHSLRLLSIIIPDGAAEFFLSYTSGLVFVLVLFTAILFERSFRLKGIILGFVYCFFVVVLSIVPYLVQFIIGVNLLYPSEMVMIQLTTLTLIGIVSVFISRYLLNKKVSV